MPVLMGAKTPRRTEERASRTETVIQTRQDPLQICAGNTRRRVFVLSARTPGRGWVGQLGRYFSWPFSAPARRQQLRTPTSGFARRPDVERSASNSNRRGTCGWCRATGFSSARRAAAQKSSTLSLEWAEDLLTERMLVPFRSNVTIAFSPPPFPRNLGRFG